MVDCQAQLGVEERANKEDLRCRDCTMQAYGAGKETCDKHGDEHIDWKCMFCCSVAVWHCFGTHFFCERCHNEYCEEPYNEVKIRDCNGVNCPLGVPHPPAHADPKKSTFPLGCGLCRAENLNEKREEGMVIQEVSLKPIEFERKGRIKLVDDYGEEDYGHEDYGHEDYGGEEPEEEEEEEPMPEEDEHIPE